MGAGRKTYTYTAEEKPAPHTTVNHNIPHRNLSKSELCGVIFGCRHITIRECLSKQLFGLPSPHFSYIKNIHPGMPLFLFNYSDRKLHGIFEAASSGQMNIDPGGWTDGSGHTEYPAQVRVTYQRKCQPLPEDQFKPVISGNYYTAKYFCFELDERQTYKLISLFSSSPLESDSLSRDVTWRNETKRLPAHDNGTNNIASLGSYVGYEPSKGGPRCGWSQVEHPQMVSEAIKEYDQDLESTEIPRKTWSSLFKTSNSVEINKQDHKMDLGENSSSSLFKETSATCAMRNQNKDCEGDSSNGNFSYTPNDNMEWVSNSTWLNEKHQFAESPTYEDGMVRNEEESWETKLDCGYPFLLTGSSTSLAAASTSLDISQTDRNQIAKCCTLVSPEVNLPHQDEFVMALSSSCLWPSPEDRGMQPPKIITEADRTDTSEVENLHTRSCFGCSNSSSVTNDLDFDSYGEAIVPFVLGPQSEDTFPSKPAPISDWASPSDLHSLVTKLMNITEDLTTHQLTQAQRISSLEHELEESKRVLQQLKDRNKELESASSGCVRMQHESITLTNASLHESIFIVGGFNGLSRLSSLDLYDPSEDLIKPLRSLSFARSHASAVRSNDEMIVLGGVDGNAWCNTVLSYNRMSNQWTDCPSLNQQKGCLAGILLERKIFAVGGGDGIECFSEVEMLDLNIGSWIFTRSMLHKRYAPAAAEINGTLYVVGGFDGNHYLKSVERFDPRQNTWTRIADMSMRRGCHSLVVLNDKLYALGGYNGSSMVTTVEVFDPRAGSWLLGEPMNDPRGYFGAVMIKDSIYTIGGMKDKNHFLDTVERYREGHGWQVTNLKGVGKRCFFSAIVM